MPARTHIRPRPADRSGAGKQLPWWAVALPALAFAALLLLILNPVDAQGASGDPALDHVLRGLQHSVLRRTP